MSRHDTPREVANLLARFAPKNLKTLLDPCTGTGVLVRPFLNSRPELQVHCIDVDSKATRAVRRLLKGFPRVKVASADFLKWSKHSGSGLRFDCIVMNPPFAARKKHLVEIVPHTGHAAGSRLLVPSEAAFIYQAISLLRPGGRLLAVVPASVVATESGARFRQALFECGAIKLVHELPPRTFSGVEGRMYLLVYEHGAAQGRMLLRNHQLADPDQLELRKERILETLRFDYSYHAASSWQMSLKSLHDLKWKSLKDVADVYRGEVDSPISKANILHTTNFYDFQPTATPSKNWRCPVQAGDIICKRVARNCAESFIPYHSRIPSRASDCILILRPKTGTHQLELLFALRVLVASPFGAHLIEHGVGATFIPFNALETLNLPLNVGKLYPGHFKKFRKMTAAGKWDEINELEASVREDLQRRLAK